MRFLDFKQQFSDFNAIAFQDIQNAFGRVNQSQLIAWKKKGYIASARKGMYIIKDHEIDNFLLANEMNDSYISLEFALSHYQMIPEITPSITSVSNSRNEEIENYLGNFYYYKVAPKLFCGFVLMESSVRKGRFIRIAEKEKALFDLIYFRKDLKTDEDFASLRLNAEKINLNRVREFIALVEAAQIKKRLDNFIKYLDAVIPRN